VLQRGADRAIALRLLPDDFFVGVVFSRLAMNGKLHTTMLARTPRGVSSGMNTCTSESNELPFETSRTNCGIESPMSDHFFDGKWAASPRCRRRGSPSRD
jgi:hypothetical protein